MSAAREGMPGYTDPYGYQGGIMVTPGSKGEPGYPITSLFLGYPLDLYSAIYEKTLFGKEPRDTWERLLAIFPIVRAVHKDDKGLDAAKSLGGGE